MSEVLTNPYRYVVPGFECQVATGQAMGLGGSGGVRTKAGVRVLSGNSAIGKTVTEVKFFLKKVGSPTGNVDLAVYNGGVDQSAGGSTLDASTVTTSFELYTFTMSHTVAVNDDIVLECTINGINDPNQIHLSQNGDATVFPDQISVNVESGVWFIFVGRNCYWCYLGS